MYRQRRSMNFTDPKVELYAGLTATRFGVGMVQAMLEARKWRSAAMIEDNIEDNEVDADLVRDMTELLTCFCARLYGRRSAANRARQAISSATE